MLRNFETLQARVRNFSSAIFVSSLLLYIMQIVLKQFLTLFFYNNLL